MRSFFLTFLEQIDDDVCDVVTMVADLSVPSCLNTDEGGVVELCDQSEDLSLSRAGPAMHQDVRGSHCITELARVHLPHPVLISDGLGNNLFGFLLRNDLAIQGLHELRWRPNPTVFKVMFDLGHYLVLLLLRQPRELKEPYLVNYLFAYLKDPRCIQASDLDLAGHWRQSRCASKEVQSSSATSWPIPHRCRWSRQSSLHPCASLGSSARQMGLPPCVSPAQP